MLTRLTKSAVPAAAAFAALLANPIGVSLPPAHADTPPAVSPVRIGPAAPPAPEPPGPMPVQAVKDRARADALQSIAVSTQIKALGGLSKNANNTPSYPPVIYPLTNGNILEVVPKDNLTVTGTGSSTWGNVFNLSTGEAVVTGTPGGSVSVSASNSSVRQVLSKLLKVSGKSGVVDPNVEGTVTAELSKVSFETAVHAVIFGSNQPLDYKLVEGVYHFHPSELQDDGSTLSRTPVTASLQHATLHDAVVLLCRQAGASYVMPDGIDGTVTADLKNVSFEDALRAVLSASTSPLTYSMSGRMVYIRRATDPYSTTRMFFNTPGSGSYGGAIGGSAGMGGGGMSGGQSGTVISTDPNASQSPMVATPSGPADQYK